MTAEPEDAARSARQDIPPIIEARHVQKIYGSVTGR